MRIQPSPRPMLSKGAPFQKNVTQREGGYFPLLELLDHSLPSPETPPRYDAGTLRQFWRNLFTHEIMNRETISHHS